MNANNIPRSELEDIVKELAALRVIHVVRDFPCGDFRIADTQVYPDDQLKAVDLISRAKAIVRLIAPPKGGAA